MKKSARSFLPTGFTFIEIILSMAILGIVVTIATPYLFGHREKARLQTEGDKIVNHLKIAQQKAIAAYKGYDYTVEFIPPREYFILKNGDPEPITYSLYETVEIESVTPNTVKFLRLTGKAEDSLSLILASKRFKIEVQVSPEGLITTSKIENR